MKRPQYNPNRYGCVLKFRKDATPEQIAKALNSIKEILEVPSHGVEYRKNNDGSATPVQIPFRWSQIVNKYDDRHGDPVFYIA